MKFEKKKKKKFYFYFIISFINKSHILIFFNLFYILRNKIYLNKKV